MSALREYWRTHPRVVTILQWLALFVGLVVSIYAATQNRAAPLVVLFVFLYIITINFSIPLPHGRTGLVPMLAVSSLLMVGFEAAVLALVLGLLLSELTRPIWRSIWPVGLGYDGRWWQRLVWGGAALLALLAADLVYLAVGGEAPLNSETLLLLQEGANTSVLNEQLLDIIWLAVAYFLTDVVLQMAFALLNRQSLGDFVQHNLPGLVGFGLLSQPLAVFGALTYLSVGLPAFVIFGLAMATFMIVAWVSWQNRVVLGQQLDQFTLLNRVSGSMRETLELTAVLHQIYEQVRQLIPHERFTLALLDEEGEWNQALVAGEDEEGHIVTTYQPDDFTRWVAVHGRMLDLDSDNMYYAAEHELIPPEPRPAVWLGVPLVADERPLGVLSLQRYGSALPFSRWNRELLLAIAQQASRAIPNAQLHGETVRLYALTDEALARRVEQLQALLNSTHEGVLMIEPSGRVVLINPLASQLLGVEAERVRGRPLNLEQASGRLGYERFALAELLQQLQQGERPSGEQVIYQLPAGAAPNGSGYQTPTYIERTGSPVVAEDGRTMGWLIVLRDVTEEQERAQWRTQFTHMIVHDLRNPVTTFLSTLRMMASKIEAGKRASGDGASAELARYVAHSQRIGSQMLDMVDSLMDINRLEAGKLIVDAEAMRLPPLVQRIVEYLRPTAEEKQIELTLAVEADVPAVWADEELMRRVVINLLDNALKFTPHGGTVGVTVGREAAAADAAASAYKHEDGVRLTVQDSGPGIPAAYRTQVFERFVRISQGGAQVRGTGIGLSFCKLAVEAQGGRIWAADGEEGMGSCFVVVVPGIPVF